MRRSHHHPSRALALPSVGVLLLAACSGPVRRVGEDTPIPEHNGGVPVPVPVPVADMLARILRVETSGELCSPSKSKIAIDATQSKLDVSIDSSPKCDPSAAVPTPLPQSQSPSCTLILDLEIPEGIAVSVPPIRWSGYWASQNELDGRATLSYSFENGGSSQSDPAVLHTSANFALIGDERVVYSDCTGRARLTATLQAQLPEDGALQLDSIDLATDWREGTDFREGCAPGERLNAIPGRLGEWCEGRRQRLCADGLACDMDEVASPPAEPTGRCTDRSAPAEIAGLDEGCSGLRNIQCAPGLTCWHPTGEHLDWLGRCRPETPGLGDPCGGGVPRIACSAPLICHNTTCISPEANEGDLCLRSGPPSCVYPLTCDRATSACRKPEGLEEDACGEALPQCQSPLYCQDQHCVDPRGHARDRCGEGTLGCTPNFVCVDEVCVVQRSPPVRCK